MRFVKIVATIGPASRDPATLRAMVRAGMDVARLNASHGTLAEHVEDVAGVHRAAADEGRIVGVLLDLAGPKLRADLGPGAGALDLLAGDEVYLRAGPGDGSPGARLTVNYPGLADEIQPGERVLLADGALELAVTGREGGTLVCRVVIGGRLAARQGIAFPDSTLHLPALTPEDEAAIEAGIAAGVDYFGLSFAASGQHVARLKRRIEAAGGDTPVVAKIERKQAVERLDEILAAADGAMVARGDLGVELPLERVPIEQRRIIQAAGRHLRPVITATQMLESMIASSRPTRAEASDVANAIWDLTDAVMLSGETAIGRYPVEAVAVMDRVIRAAESAPVQESLPVPVLETDNHSFVIAAAARRMAEFDRNIRAIVCFTKGGTTAVLLSKVHPPVPIYAVSPVEATLCRLTLARGVIPVRGPWVDSSEAMLGVVDDVLVAEGLLEPGAESVVVGSLPVKLRGVANFLKLHTVGESTAVD